MGCSNSWSGGCNCNNNCNNWNNCRDNRCCNKSNVDPCAEAKREAYCEGFRDGCNDPCCRFGKR